METELVSVQLPVHLYEKLQTLASEQQTDPVSLIAHLVTDASRQKNWRERVDRLRQQIQHDGGLNLGNTKAEVIARLRQTREEIFEAEYAHLYR
jgi:hypothetical protein